MFDLNQIMSQAQEMQRKMKEDRARQAIHGASAGGQVKVVVNANKEITKIDIDPVVMKDPDILADHILAAVSGAYAEVDAKFPDQLPGLPPGMDLDAIMNMFKK